MSQRLSELFLSAAAVLQKGDLDAAETIYRSILDEFPRNPDALHFLGIIAHERKNHHEALGLIYHAVRLNPNNRDYHASLSRVWVALGDYHAAAEALKGALHLDPKNSAIALDIARLLWELREVDATVQYARLAISLDPKRPLAHVMLGNALGHQADHYGAVACFRQALRMRPDRDWIRSKLLYALQRQEVSDQDAIKFELREYNRLHVVPLKPLIKPHLLRDPSRRKLRIGWVSPDFRRHVVGRCMLPVFEAFDRDRFENFCYFSLPHCDDVTEAIRKSVDAWREISQVNDDAAAEMVRADAPDVLVDLALHTSDGRPLLFARKPAPVQAAYLGYAGSTGIETVDYRISNPRLDPPGSDLTVYTEKTVLLSGSYLCYRPEYPVGEVTPLPALANGFLTFGCLGSPTKISNQTLTIWAQILREHHASRMILYVASELLRKRVLGHFELHGIAPDRIEFLTTPGWHKYVQTYGRIDLALDTFPNGAGVTACDAMWMGVPIVTLIGSSATRRMCFSVLYDVGHAEWAANSPEQYCQIVAALAGDLGRLTELRAKLRQQIESSPLMDASAVARDLERIFTEVGCVECAADPSPQ
jgi:protein O-GlcNAc transferase